MARSAALTPKERLKDTLALIKAVLQLTPDVRSKHELPIAHPRRVGLYI
jgi:hypothetical protein